MKTSRFSLLVFIFVICILRPLFADVIDDSLRLRFSFDSAPTNGIIVDASPSATHPGTNINAIWIAGEDGRNGVMDFKAPQVDRITVSPIPAFNSTQGTISFWFKSTNTAAAGNFAAILFDRRSSQGDVIALTDDGTIFVQARANGQNVNSFSSTAVVNDGAWHHLDYVYDQSAQGSISIFIDGVLDTNQANAQAWAWDPNQPLELGSSHDTYWRIFEGFMDDFQIHNRMLSPAEVTATVAGNPVTDASLVLRLNFDAAPVNNIVLDGSASNHPGTNQSAIWISGDSGHSGIMAFSSPAVTQITVPADPDFDASSGTIAFWMKSSGNTGPGEFASMLFDRRAGGDGDVIVMQDDGTLFVQARGGGQGANSFSTQGKVNDGAWHHVAYVYDQAENGFIHIYIDGALSGSKTNSLAWAWPTDQEIELGLSHDPFWFAFTGALDEVRFYNRPLIAAEIVAIGVAPTLHFDLQPLSQTVFVGDDVTLVGRVNVEATYRWKVGSSDISGGTNGTLILTNVQVANAGSYTVTASNALDQLTSNPALLTVNPRPALEASRVARYNFDAAPINGVIVDSAPGSKHPGTNILASWVADVEGRSGVMQFTAADPGSQIVIPPSADFDSSQGAITFWMKSAGNGDDGDFGAILFDRRSNRGDVIVMQDDGTLFVQAYSSTAHVNSFATTRAVNDDQWHHVAYVYDQGSSGSTLIYVDGQLAGSKASSGPWSWDPTQELEWGKSHDPFWRRIDGYLDDVQFFNRGLSAAEVAQVMNPSPTGPTLAFSSVGNQLTLSWTDTGFALQQNSNVSNPSGWSNVTGGTSSPITVTISPSGNNFYRLQKQ